MRAVLHLVVPDSVDDPTRPSGGNTYDRRLADELSLQGWAVQVHHAPGAWPCPDAADRDALADRLASLPDGSLVVLDGLVACGVPAVVVPATHRVRVVVLVHLPLALSGPLGAASAERAVLGAAAAVVTTSGWTRRWLVEQYALAPDRVSVALPGVDRAERSVGSPHGGRLLCVAALVPTKGHAALVDALATLTDLPWQLTCAGSTDLDPEHVAHLHAQCAGHGVAERVAFTGPLGAAELTDAYAAADLVLLTSRLETYGLVVTEGLARGVPVLATRVGGIPEAVGRTSSGVPGLLVDPDDPDALAAALRSWLTDEPLRRRLRRVALDRRRTLEPWSTTARSVTDVLGAVPQ